MLIYFPMSARILTAGHIRCLKWLSKKSPVIVGLLTDRAMMGYKNPIVPFKDRLAVMKAVAKKVVPQDSLDPTENIKKYKPTAIASGDGWEKCELEAIKKYKLKRIDIPFTKKYSVSEIIKRAIKIHL